MKNLSYNYKDIKDEWRLTPIEQLQLQQMPITKSPKILFFPANKK
jgi:hypothetical protein